jgi:hypothetical protein
MVLEPLPLRAAGLPWKWSMALSKPNTVNWPVAKKHFREAGQRPEQHRKQRWRPLSR